MAKKGRPSAVASLGPLRRLQIAWKWIVLAPLLAVFAVFFLTVVDPFGFESATKRQSANIFYKIYAAGYPIHHRGNISVVFVDDETVNSRNESWPPSHLLHGDVLAAILGFEPVAVLVDIYFIHEREGDHFARTAVVINDYNDKSVPLFMIAARSPLPPARKDLQWLARDDKVKLVSAEIESELGESPLYPLSGSSAHKPAAFAIYEMICAKLPATWKSAEIKCEKHHRQDSAEFEVVWGLEPAPFNCLRAEDKLREVCRELSDVGPFRRALHLIAEGLIPGIWRPTDPVSIPYHATISAQDVLDGGKRADLAPLLTGRIVIYGARLALVKDQVYSPVHGSTEGAFVHAMALDNLLTFGDRVVHRGAGHKRFKKEWTEFQPAALMVLAGLFIGFNRWRLLCKGPPDAWEYGVKETDDHVMRWMWWILVVTVSVAGLLEFAIWDISPFNWFALIIVVHMAHRIEKLFFNPKKWVARASDVRPENSAPRARSGRGRLLGWRNMIPHA